VVSATDYYPFGWEMPGRSVNKAGYRFGFNGKENDRDEWGQQLVQDYGFRLYNPAIGKFLSVDPLAPEYPWYTPYQFAGNKPIWAVDLDGLEEKIVTLHIRWGDDGNPSIHNISVHIDYSKIIEGKAKTVLVVSSERENGAVVHKQQTATFEETAYSGRSSLPPAAMFDYSSEDDMAMKKELDDDYIRYGTTGTPESRRAEIANRDKSDASIERLEKERKQYYNLMDYYAFRGSGKNTSETALGIKRPYKHKLKYDERVRKRATQDPSGHNFPYSFDDIILATKPELRPGGYKMYQVKVKEGKKVKVYEIGVTKDGVIDHRVFREIKK
jgi:RHS repeat-associated protein